MEADRYQKNHTLFIVGMISLLIGLCFMVFGLYLFPNLIFGWRYEVPGFIPVVKEWLQSSYHYSEAGAAQFIFFFLFLIGLLLIIVAYFSSNRIDDEIYHVELETAEEMEKEEKPKEVNHEGMKFGMEMLLIVLAVFLLGGLFEWLIYTPSEEELRAKEIKRANQIEQLHNTDTDQFDVTN